LSQTNIGTCASGVKEAEASMNDQPIWASYSREYREWKAWNESAEELV
jgi:hypothetical protein